MCLCLPILKTGGRPRRRTPVRPWPFPDVSRTGRLSFTPAQKAVLPYRDVIRHTVRTFARGVRPARTRPFVAGTGTASADAAHTKKKMGGRSPLAPRTGVQKRSGRAPAQADREVCPHGRAPALWGVGGGQLPAGRTVTTECDVRAVNRRTDLHLNSVLRRDRGRTDGWDVVAVWDRRAVAGASAVTDRRLGCRGRLGPSRGRRRFGGDGQAAEGSYTGTARQKKKRTCR